MVSTLDFESNNLGSNPSLPQKILSLRLVEEFILEDKKIKAAREALAGSEAPDPVKFFDENKDDIDFIYFLQSIFARVEDVDGQVREKVGSVIGEDLANAFYDTVDQQYLKVDKRLLEGVIYADSDDDFKESMKKLLKSIKKDL